jgi:hypothetical protein
MKKLIILILLSVSIFGKSFSQRVGIGTNTPNAAAILHLNSSNKGFLLPSLILTGISDNITIPLPPTGLMVWHNDKTSLQGLGVYINSGNAASPRWRKLGSSDDYWSQSGNSGAEGAKLGHLDYRPLQFIVGNQHIGRLGGNANILLGLNSGNSLPITDESGSANNVVIGNGAFALAATGNSNIVIGNGSMGQATGGNFGIGIGDGALYSQAPGAVNNLAIGTFSQYYTTSGNENLALGASSLYRNVANSRSTAIGHLALQNADNRSGGRSTYNSAIGYSALRGSNVPASNTGRWNTAIGDSTLAGNTSGDGNTASGAFALSNNTTGSRNVAIGFGAARSNQSGNGNIALGSAALRLNNNNSFNIAIGDSALYATGQFGGANGEQNIGIGKNALYKNQTGDDNIAVGNLSLYNQQGGSNLAFGHGALYKSQSGSKNIAVGNGALYNLETAYDNIAIGDSAMVKMATNLNSAIQGNQNIAIGTRALYQNITGTANIAIGPYALELNTNNDNTVIGNNALSYNTTGSKNLALGQAAGLNNLTGSGNVFIGYSAGLNETGSNKLYIANSDASAADALIYGEFNNALLRVNGKLNLKGTGLTNGIEFGYNIGKGSNNGRIGYALLTANTLDIVGAGTTTGTRSIKLWAEGGASITGNTDIDGFTRLGTAAEAAPRVKMKKINVTGPAVNAFTSHATGIADTKILGVSILMNYSSTWKMPPNYTDTPGFEYNYQVQNGNVVIINKTGNSANIGNKPITILITYEE